MVPQTLDYIHAQKCSLYCLNFKGLDIGWRKLFCHFQKTYMCDEMKPLNPSSCFRRRSIRNIINVMWILWNISPFFITCIHLYTMSPESWHFVIAMNLQWLIKYFQKTLIYAIKLFFRFKWKFIFEKQKFHQFIWS